MESKPSSRFFRTAVTIVVTAIIQSIIFCLIVGLPMPQFFSSRDVEALQFQKLPDQKRNQPIEALDNLPLPKARPMKRAAVEKQSEAKTEDSSEATKVLVVNFNDHKVKSKKVDEQPKQETPEVTSEPVAAEPTASESAAPQEQPTAEQKPEEEKPQFIPVSDKLAGVQADDSATEATAAVNTTPADQDSSAAVDSMEKTTTSN